MEYSCHRGLMENDQTFSIFTGQALDYTCTYYQKDLTAEQKQLLLESYGTLPAFADAQEALTMSLSDYP